MYLFDEIIHLFTLSMYLRTYIFDDFTLPCFRSSFPSYLQLQFLIKLGHKERLFTWEETSEKKQQGKKKEDCSGVEFQGEGVLCVNVFLPLSVSAQRQQPSPAHTVLALPRPLTSTIGEKRAD